MGDDTTVGIRVRIIPDTQAGKQKAVSDVKEIEKAGDAASQKITQANQRAAQSYRQVGAAARTAGREAASFGATAAASVGATTRGLQQSAVAGSLLGGTFARLQGQLLSLNGAVAGFTAGFAAIAAVRELSNFGDQMASVRAVTLATDADFAKLRETALNLGSTTRFSATEAARGLELLARAGADTQGSLALIVPTLQLAQAEELQLGETSDFLAKITQSMKLELADGARVANILSATASKTATDVRQLGQAFKYAGPIAAGFKTPIEDVAAILGVLANRGLTGDQGGTALRGIFSKAASSEDQKAFVKALDSVHLKLRDIDPAVHGVIGALQNLHNANITTSESFQLFKQRAGTGADILINAIDEVNALRAELKALPDDFLQKKFEIKRDTLANDLNQVLAQVRNLIIALGDAGLERALRTVLQVVASTLSGITLAINTLAPILLNIGIGFAVAFSPFLLLGFIEGIVRLIALLPLLIGLVFRLGAALVVFALSNPFTAFAVGIGLAITAVQRFGDDVLISGSKSATLADLFQAAQNRIATGFSDLVTYALRAMGLIDEGTAAATKSMEQRFKNAFDAIAESLKSFADLVVQGLANAVNGLTGEINFLPPLRLLNPQGGVLDKLKRDAEGLAQTRIGSSFTTTIEGGSDKPPGDGKHAGGFGKEIDYVKQLLKEIQGPADDAREAIGVLNDLFGDGTITATQYADTLQRLREKLLSNDQTIFGGIAKGLNQIAASATALGDQIGNFVTSAFGHATDAIVEFTRTGKFNFSNFVNSILSDLVRLSANVLFGQIAKAALGGLGGGFGNVGGNVGGNGGLAGVGSLFGFATGGAFTVAGNGGTDSQVVAFRATPGERVSVATPQQQGRGGPGTIVNVINHAGAQVRTEKRRSAGGAEITDVIISTVSDGIARGRLDDPLGGRFGVGATPIRR
jgi:TP901 family phage tail tape measure protein